MKNMPQPEQPLGAGDPRRVGRWKLTGRLGAGGMGAVYLGRSGDEWAAVKVISRGLANSPGFRARCEREIAATRRVSGSRVAELIDADSESVQPWLAMRY